MREAILVPSPPQAEEPRDLSFNRYTLQTEIAATPTKQTTGTLVNRYKNRPARRPTLSSPTRDFANATGIRNRRKWL